MGDPMRTLMWVSKSRAKLAAALRKTEHKITANSIPKLLAMLKYRRQVKRKALEGSSNPDRNAQFEHINAGVLATPAAGQQNQGVIVYLGSVKPAARGTRL
jgi:hypothetical protein